MKNNYPDNEKDRKKALAAQQSFYSNSELYEKEMIKNTVSEIEILIKHKQFSPVIIEYLHNANWHLTQALKIIDEVK